MSWDEYGAKRRSQYGRKIAIGVALLIAVATPFVVVFSNAKSSDKNHQENLEELRSVFAAPTTTTTSPQAAQGAIDIMQEDLSEEEVDRYVDNAVSPDALRRLYPQAQSGLDSATYDQVRSIGERLITAEETLRGRESFPSYWGPSTPTTSPTRAFVIDFSTAFSVPDQPNLFKALVVWHGETWSGSVVTQMRKSIYFSNNGGTFSPVRPDKLPENVMRRDPFIDGVRLFNTDNGSDTK